MGNIIADIFVTVKPTAERLALTAASLDSLRENTDRSQYRLTVCFDGNLGVYKDRVAVAKMVALEDWVDYTIQSHKNEGLGPTINRAVAHIKSINDWYSDPRAGDPERVAPYVVMCQDDLLYTKDWLPILASRFRAYGLQHKLGFASGVECIEHPVRKRLGDGIVLKDWIRASQMLSTR